MYNALTHSNEKCHNLLHTKLNCMRSENVQYLSYEYQLSDRDWYKDLEHLLGNVKIEFSELCSIRGNIVICNTINNEDACKLINFLCTDYI